MASAGWQTLGNRIGGGNELPSTVAYEQGLSLGANTQDALAQARSRVDQNNAKENADQALSGSIPDPKLRALVVNSIQGGYDPRNVTGSMSDAFKLSQQQLVANQATPDDQAGRSLAAIGQPGIVKAVGDNGNLINELHPSSGVQISPLGQAIGSATAAKDTAAAAASNSEVPLHAAQANLAGAQAAALPGTKEPTKYAPLLDANGQQVIDQSTGLPKLVDRAGGSADINAPKPMGAREAQQANRALILGQQATRDLQQVTSIPVGTGPGGLLGMAASAMPSLGIAGYGSGPQRSLLESVKADLTNRAAPEAVQQYSVLSSGMARMLMGLENPGSQGNSGGQVIMDQFNKLNLLDGDSNELMMTKLAKQKQIIESSLQEQIINSNRTPQAYKDSAQAILDNLNKAIPFEPEDVIRLHNGDGKQTLGSILGVSPAASKFQASAAPGAAPTAAAPAPAAAAPALSPDDRPAVTAPPGALALLAAHPEMKAQFLAKYGALPPGMQ